MKLKVLDEAVPWYADGLTFTCTQCGNCCTGEPGYIWISDVEITRLANYLKIGEAQVVQKFCRRIGNRLSLRERKSPGGLHDCIFLQQIKIPGPRGTMPRYKRVCGVYGVRPLQCRTWPFWDGLLASRQSWERAKQGCPGMDSGTRKFTRKQIEALRDATDWPERPPTSR